MEVQGFRTEMLSRLPRCGWEERERRLGPRARPTRARGWERLLAAEFDWSLIVLLGRVVVVGVQVVFDPFAFPAAARARAPLIIGNCVFPIAAS